MDPDSVARWLLVGAVAATWFLVALGLNLGHMSDLMERQVSTLPERHRPLFVLLVAVFYFITGPVGLGFVLYKTFSGKGKGRDG